MTIPVDNTWKLTFDDEFNGSTLKGDWTPGWFGSGITPPVNTEEDAVFNSANVSVSGGYLNLASNGTDTTLNGHTYHNQGSMVETQGSFEQNGGYFEARMFLNSDGTDLLHNWPAFWLNGDQGTWPDHTEVDVLEGLGGDASGHVHWGVDAAHDHNQGFTSHGNYAGWHIFGANVQNGEVDFYYDNSLVYSMVDASFTTAATWLVLNQTFKDNGGTSYPNAGDTIKADWVHVYAQTGGTAVTPDTGYTGPGGLGPTLINGTTGDDTINGTAANETINGLGGNDHLYGNSGNDTITADGGDDVLSGGLGNDVLNGGAGHDDYYLGGGTDTIMFNSASDAGVTIATRDIVRDLSGSDVINLHGADANSGVAGNQDFSFIGSAAFSHTAGELHYVVAGSDCKIQGDTNGDGVADFEIYNVGVTAMNSGDFIL